MSLYLSSVVYLCSTFEEDTELTVSWQQWRDKREMFNKTLKKSKNDKMKNVKTEIDRIYDCMFLSCVGSWRSWLWLNWMCSCSAVTRRRRRTEGAVITSLDGQPSNTLVCKVQLRPSQHLSWSLKYVNDFSFCWSFNSGLKIKLGLKENNCVNSADHFSV